MQVSQRHDRDPLATVVTIEQNRALIWLRLVQCLLPPLMELALVVGGAFDFNAPAFHSFQVWAAIAALLQVALKFHAKILGE